jgi:hypothetical protein
MPIVDPVDGSCEVPSDLPLWVEYATTFQPALQPEMALGDKATPARMPLQDSDDLEEVGSDFPLWTSY